MKIFEGSTDEEVYRMTLEEMLEDVSEPGRILMSWDIWIMWSVMAKTREKHYSYAKYRGSDR